MNTSTAWIGQLAWPGLAAASLVLLVVLLVAAAAIDLRTYRIPNWLTFGGAAAALALHTAIAWSSLSAAWALDGFLFGLGGLAAGLALMLPMYLLRVMGAGDVKLMAMVGAFLGLAQVLLAALCVFVAGGIAAVLYALAKRRLVHLGTNLGSLAQGAALSLLTGHRVLGLGGASVGRLPYGVSISAGTLAYLAARHFHVF